MLLPREKTGYRQPGCDKHCGREVCRTTRQGDASAVVAR